MNHRETRQKQRKHEKIIEGGTGRRTTNIQKQTNSAAREWEEVKTWGWEDVNNWEWEQVDTWGRLAMTSKSVFGAEVPVCADIADQLAARAVPWPGRLACSQQDFSAAPSPGKAHRSDVNGKTDFLPSAVQYPGG